jgi:hypothetical protein
VGTGGAKSLRNYTRRMHLPSLVRLVTIDFADQLAARTFAELLVDRGYRVVVVGLNTFGQHRVSGIEQGPYPSSDETWWAAHEVRVLRIYGAVGAVATDEQRARKMLGSGECLVDRTVEEAAAARLVSFEGVMPRAARPPGFVCTETVSDDSRGSIALPGLHDVDWTTLDGAYGTANEVPEILAALAENDGGWREALSEYFGSVIHQGTCYSCTPVTVQFLVTLAVAPKLSSQRRIEVLMTLLHAMSDEPTRAAIARGLPTLFAEWSHLCDSERAWLTTLVAADPGSRLPTEIEEFAADLNSPTLDLAVALAADDSSGSQGIILQATTWDEQVPDLLRDPFEVLLHLAMNELR